jgi:hypothetical protein
VGGVNAGRVVLVLSCVVVGALGAWFAVARWDDANKVAAVASALGAVVAVGVAVWAALRTAPGNAITVRRTGRAEARGGGSATTGVRGRVDGTVRVERTGDAVSDGGDATTGVRLD